MTLNHLEELKVNEALYYLIVLFHKLVKVNPEVPKDPKVYPCFGTALRYFPSEKQSRLFCAGWSAL